MTSLFDADHTRSGARAREIIAGRLRVSGVLPTDQSDIRQMTQQTMICGAGATTTLHTNRMHGGAEQSTAERGLEQGI